MDPPKRALSRDIAASQAARGLRPGPDRDTAMAAVAEGHAERMCLSR